VKTPPRQQKAYLNWIFFDEQFNYVEENSGATPVFAVTAGNTTSQATISINSYNGARVPKNGYVYVYLSNDSRNIPVYFDDFDVIHTRGAIIEDNAYYPFGLKIAGISAKAALKPQAKEGYQGDYTEHDEESGYDEFELRSYDAQIGRFIQVDPKLVQPGMYNGMTNDPVNMVDPDGGGPTDWFKNLANGTYKFFEGLGAGDHVKGFEWAFKEGPVSMNNVQGWGDAFGNFVERTLIPVIVNSSNPKSAFINRMINSAIENFKNWNILKGLEDFYASTGGNFPTYLDPHQMDHPHWHERQSREQFQDGVESAKLAASIYVPELLFAKVGQTYDIYKAAKVIKDLKTSVTVVEETAIAAKGVTNLIPEGKLANHLFKGAGKLADNPANRSLIQNLANSKAIVVDAFGKSWHMGFDGAGKSIYTYTQNGVVKGAGYATMKAEQMILKYGLK
jgi:RHS repeat-associated protein